MAVIRDLRGGLLSFYWRVCRSPTLVAIGSTLAASLSSRLLRIAAAALVHLSVAPLRIVVAWSTSGPPRQALVGTGLRSVG